MNLIPTPWVWHGKIRTNFYNSLPLLGIKMYLFFIRKRETGHRTLRTKNDDFVFSDDLISKQKPTVYNSDSITYRFIVLFSAAKVKRCRSQLLGHWLWCSLLGWSGQQDTRNGRSIVPLSPVDCSYWMDRYAAALQSLNKYYCPRIAQGVKWHRFSLFTNQWKLLALGRTKLFSVQQSYYSTFCVTNTVIISSFNCWANEQLIHMQCSTFDVQFICLNAKWWNHSEMHRYLFV